MRRIYNVKSNAKINVGLRILSKRKDGYHNIETVFYPVKLYDKIEIKITPSWSEHNKISVYTTPRNKIPAQNNICYKAVDLFFDRFKIQKRFQIRIGIRKNIPIGAGLGGGSSNAAATLKILAKYFRIPTGSKKLLKIALELGSDVPFFLQNKPAYAFSRGERLTFLNKFKIPCRILFVYPLLPIYTKWAYETLNIGTKKNKVKFSDIKYFDIKNAREIYVNDFEKTVFNMYPEIKDIKEKMYSFGSDFSLMSGSGSAVYGLFKKRNRLLKAKKYFKGKNYFTAEG